MERTRACYCCIDISIARLICASSSSSSSIGVELAAAAGVDVLAAAAAAAELKCGEVAAAASTAIAASIIAADGTAGVGEAAAMEDAAAAGAGVAADDDDDAAAAAGDALGLDASADAADDGCTSCIDIANARLKSSSISASPPAAAAAPPPPPRSGPFHTILPPLSDFCILAASALAKSPSGPRIRASAAADAVVAGFGRRSGCRVYSMT